MYWFVRRILERGITVPSVQVIVCQADHAVFTSASLIQIFGRVGRSFDDPTGKGVCFMFSKKFRQSKNVVDQSFGQMKCFLPRLF